MFHTEPFSGYTISGPHDDGTFKVFTRDACGDHTEIGSADDYESAREIALADDLLMRDAWEDGFNHPRMADHALDCPAWSGSVCRCQVAVMRER